MYHLIDYVWCVDKFSQYFEPHDQEVYPLLTSPIFAYKNTRWVLNLYPEGLGDSASQGYISLFIKYVSEDPETINAKVELSLLNNKNERVYCRDTGDHQYQTFIDFGYKQFLKIQDIKEQKEDLIFNGQLKIFARVEFEHATLPSSLTWSNYDLLLFKENFKDLYETKNLCDIIVKVIKKPVQSNSQQTNLYRATNINNLAQNNTTTNNLSTNVSNTITQTSNSNHHYHPYSLSGNQNSSSSTHHHQYSKLKKISNNNKNGLSSNGSSYVSDTLESKPCLPEYLSPSSPFNQSNLKDCSNSTNECSELNNNSTNFNYNLNTSLFNKLTKCCGMMDSANVNYGFNYEELETQEIKAHKFILASRSGKFRELLKTNLVKLRSNKNLHDNSNKTTSVSCHQCNLKISSNVGCSSVNCLYKNTKTNQISINNNNPGETITSTTNSNNNNSLTSKATNQASEDLSLCSSSYASCSSTSSSSGFNNNDPCCCTCSCTKRINSLQSEPCSSFLSSSSNEENQKPCPVHQSETTPITPSVTCHICEQNEQMKSAKLSILTNEEASSIDDLLVIETDRSPKVIEYLIRYMYTGYLDTLDSFSKDIYEISKEYKVHGLTNLAREHIIRELNIHNCCDYLIFCVINNDYELNSKIQVFIAENYDTIIKTNSYKQAKRKYRELFENTFNEISKKIPTLNKTHY